jgi:hypothetical protein
MPVAPTMAQAVAPEKTDVAPAVLPPNSDSVAEPLVAIPADPLASVRAALAARKPSF